MGPGDQGNISLRRVARAIFALSLGAVALFFSIGTLIQYREFRQFQVAEPAHFSIDLSRPGFQEAPLTYTSRLAHGLCIYLCFPNQPDRQPSDLHGLKGTLAVLKEDGTSVDETTFSDSSFGRWEQVNSQGEVGLTLTAPTVFTKGVYTLRVNVVEPALSLSGHKQMLIAKNRFCGCESLPTFYMGMIALVTGLPALVIGIATLLEVKRLGWRQVPSSADGTTAQDINDAPHV